MHLERHAGARATVEEAVACRLHAELCVDLQQIGQQIAALGAGQPVGRGHQIDVVHRAMREVEGQRSRAGEIDLSRPGPVGQALQEPSRRVGERFEVGRRQVGHSGFSSAAVRSRPSKRPQNARLRSERRRLP